MTVNNCKNNYFYNFLSLFRKTQYVMEKKDREKWTSND